MKILGINCFMHDAAASLVVDGKIVAAAEEERFSRVKHSGSFPVLAAQYCLQSAGLTLDDLDHIAFYMKPWQKLFHLGIGSMLRSPSKALSVTKGEVYGSVRMLHLPLYIRNFLGYDVRKKGGRFLLFIDHHTCHTAGAFLTSGFERAAVMSIDGAGEHATCVLSVADKNRIRVLRRTYFPHSLGFVYAAVTSYLGFRPFSDEYKVMGLAPYGEPSFYETFKDIVRLSENGTFSVDTSYFTYMHDFTGNLVSGKFLDRLGPQRYSDDAHLDKQAADIAASLQKRCEDVGLALARYARTAAGCDDLCISGGVGLNCVMNGTIARQGTFTRVFVQPAAHDAGTSLGAALYAHHYLGGSSCWGTMKDVYLGPEFSDGHVKVLLESNNLRFTRHDDIERTVAALLAQQKIVGWFQGRMEFGQRALGARSILADPRNPRMKDIVNEKIKHREPFRPFAPAVLEEKAPEFFESCASSPFMTIIFSVKPEKRKMIPAVTHEDGTARVQTVSRRDNPRFWRLIHEFGSMTGVPVILNTSFNVKGEPIVCTPEDALRCFYTTGLDFMAIGNFLVEK